MPEFYYQSKLRIKNYESTLFANRAFVFYFTAIIPLWRSSKE
jgi:hypothetical protein